VETNQALTVEAILDRYQVECLPELAPRTQKDYVRHLATLKQIFGERIADDLEPKDFAPFLNNGGKPRGRIQKVRQLAVLSAAFTQAVSYWFVMKRNPLRDVKSPKSKPRDRLIEDWEFKAVLALAPLRVRLMMRLALKIGQRQGDLLNLKWEDIKGDEIHIYQSKTRKRLAIGIDKELEALLDECWVLPMGGRGGGEYVITRGKRNGGRYTSEGFRACWQRVQRKWRKSGGKPWTFHDIRALCATKCPSPEFAMRLLGHTTIGMTMRVYRRGVERVPALPTGA
jgi:integrase